ncbi:translation initiation factor IF-2-like [Falco biarmicus]|uniref:translation initiation factor IF-2-like n=1 Tax=Falco cherrug TaxID=345164 RepID=UPI00247A327A|nr:translation initiation factor IF-2-like [Falco cherrug]XP_056190152.1 translation initiation factor IF-2-like [Falco biarmicus]
MADIKPRLAASFSQPQRHSHSHTASRRGAGTAPPGGERAQRGHGSAGSGARPSSPRPGSGHGAPLAGVGAQRLPAGPRLSWRGRRGGPAPRRAVGAAPLACRRVAPGKARSAPTGARRFSWPRVPPPPGGAACPKEERQRLSLTASARREARGRGAGKRRPRPFRSPGGRPGVGPKDSLAPSAELTPARPGGGAARFASRAAASEQRPERRPARGSDCGAAAQPRSRPGRGQRSPPQGPARAPRRVAAPVPGAPRRLRESGGTRCPRRARALPAPRNPVRIRIK